MPEFLLSPIGAISVPSTASERKHIAEEVVLKSVFTVPCSEH